MANLPPGNKGPGLGALSSMAGKMVLKAALTVLLNTKSIVDHLAAEAYRDETDLEFSKLSASEKALWVNRVQSVIRAASSTVSF